MRLNNWSDNGIRSLMNEPNTVRRMSRSRFWFLGLGLIIGLACGVILARWIGGDAGDPAEKPRVNAEEDRALIAAGLAYAEVEKWDQALERFGQFVKLHPENLPARLNLGITLRQAGSLDEAGRLFDELFEALPDEWQAEVEFQRSLMEYERGQTGEELASINRAIELGIIRPMFFGRLCSWCAPGPTKAGVWPCSKR